MAVSRTIPGCLLLCLLIAGPAAASGGGTRVTLSGVHLCCKACVKGVQKVAAQVNGATFQANADAGTVTVTAISTELAQKAIDAVAAAGFHGRSDHESVKVRDDSGAPDKTVDRLELEGAHLCCGKCVRAVNDALAKVKGFGSTTAEKKKSTFTIIGNFNARAAVAALNKAGLHVRVRQP